MPQDLIAKITTSHWDKFKKILIPLLISVILGFLIYYGGDAYQGIGLAGIGTAQIVFGYVLGISEFLVIALLLQRLVQYIILEWLFSSASGGPAPRLLTQLSAFIIYLFAITAIIGIVFKKDLTVILAASGAAGIVVGMALRELILDIFAGLALNLDRTIKIGDSILLKTAGDTAIEGTVKEISWRTTQVLTKFYNTIIIPNSRLASAVVTNYSLPKPFFKIKLIMMLDFAVPSDRVIRVLQAAALEASGQFSSPEAPKPSVNINEITKDGISYMVSIYPSFATRTTARNLAFQAMLRHLDCAGLNQSLSSTGVSYRRSVKPQETLSQPEPAQLTKMIGKTFLFKDLTETDRQLLASLAPLRKLQAGAVIVHTGEAAIAMFFLIEGLLLAESTQRGKLEKSFTTITPGNLIGGEVMLLGSSYEHTVKTQTTSLICEINYKVLGGLLAHQPTLAYKLSQRVAKQMIEKVAHEGTSKPQWQMSETDLTEEVFRNLKRSFII